MIKVMVKYANARTLLSLETALLVKYAYQM